MKSDFTLAVRFATIGCNIFDAVKIIWDGKVAKGETVNIPTQKKSIFHFHCISEFAGECICVFPMNP